MNNKSEETPKNVSETVYLTRDAKGVVTGGKTVIRCRADGKEIARFGYDPSGQETFHETVSYHSNEIGEKVEGVTFYPDGSLWQKSVVQFNREGEIVEAKNMNAAGEVTDRQTYSYTEDSVHYCRFDKVQRLIEEWTKHIER